MSLMRKAEVGGKAPRGYRAIRLWRQQQRKPSFVTTTTTNKELTVQNVSVTKATQLVNTFCASRGAVIFTRAGDKETPQFVSSKAKNRKVSNLFVLLTFNFL